nr:MULTISPECIES: hypothetical protein [Acetobacter]
MKGADHVPVAPMTARLRKSPTLVLTFRNFWSVRSTRPTITGRWIGGA